MELTVSRWLTRQLAVIALVCGLIASVSQSRQVFASSSKYGGNLKVAIAQGIPGFCIGNNPDVTAVSVHRSIYEPLIEKRGDGTFAAVLATSVTSSSDFKTWQIEIREGVKFHDGTDLDAAVVVKNLDWLRGAPFLSEGPTYGHSIGIAAILFSNVVSASVVDTLTLDVELEKPDAHFRDTLWMGGRTFIRGANQLGPSGTSCANNPIGTGPFKLDTWNDAGIKVIRSNNYWRVDGYGNRLPYLDSILFTHVHEHEVRASSLRAGNIDLALFFSAGEFGSIKELRDEFESFNEIRSLRAFVTGLWLNQGLQGTALQSLKARQAVSYALDLESLRQNLEDWDLSPPSKSPSYSRSMLGAAEHPFNMAHSKQLVGEFEAEFGKSLSVGLNASTSSAEQALVREIDWSLQSAGIDSTRTVEESAVLISKMYNANMGNQLQTSVTSIYGDSFSSLIPYLKTSVFENSNNSLASISTSFGSTMNLSRHSNTEIDRLLNEARSTSVPHIFNLKMQSVLDEIAETVLFVPIGNAYISTFSTKLVHGIGDASPAPGETREISSFAGIDYSTVYKSTAFASQTPGQEHMSSGLLRFTDGDLVALAAIEGTDFIYGIDQHDVSIQKISLQDSSMIERIPLLLSDQVDSLSGLVIDAARETAYISDQGNGNIYKLNLVSGSMSVLGNYPGALTDLILSENGSFLVALDAAGGKLLKISPSDGELLLSKTLDSGQYGFPSQLPSDTPFLVNKTSNELIEFNFANLSSRSSQTLGFNAGASTLMPGARYLYVVDTDTNLVRQFDVASGVTVGSLSGGDKPLSMVSLAAIGIVIFDSLNDVAALVSFPRPIWTKIFESEDEPKFRFRVNFGKEFSGLSASDFSYTGTAANCSFTVIESLVISADIEMECSGTGSVIPNLLYGSIRYSSGLAAPSSDVAGPVSEVLSSMFPAPLEPAPPEPVDPAPPANPPTNAAPDSPVVISDTTAPSASWSIIESTALLEVEFELEFSENVTGLTSGDLVNGGNAPGCVFSIEGSGANYIVTATCAGPGTLRPVLLDGSVIDASKNAGPLKNVSAKIISVGLSSQTSTTAVVVTPFAGSAPPTSVALSVSGLQKTFTLPLLGGAEVKVLKKPNPALASQAKISVKGKKVTMGLEAPKAKKKSSQVKSYLVELRTLRGVRVVGRTLKVKAGQRIFPVLNSKKKGLYVVVVTATQVSGKKMSWMGPRLKIP